MILILLYDVIMVTLFSGYVDAAMKTALYLREYEDIIDPCDIYALLGMCKQLLLTPQEGQS